jgi:hypothetical protein
MATEPDSHEHGEWHRAGLARAFFIFIVGLGAAGVLIGVLNGPFDAVMATGDTLGQSQQAQTGQGYVNSFWDSLPIIIVVLAFLQLLSAAAAEGRFG